MPITGLPTALVQIPLAAGLNQRMDARAKQPPSLDICKDVQFDEAGGLQARHPFGVTLSLIDTNGATIANPRSTVVNGDELLLFTDVALYSRVESANAWSFRGEHLAISVDEEVVFGSNGDQVCPDRAQLNGVTVYSWQEGTICYVAAMESSTGAVVVSSVAFPGVERARIVALATRIMLFFRTTSSGALSVIAIDPANVAASLVATPTNIISVNATNFDVVMIDGTDTAIGAAGIFAGGLTYDIFTVTAALVINKVSKSRQCDGPVAVAVEPGGGYVQVVRPNGLNIEGDLLIISTLADVTFDTVIGTISTVFSTLQIAACFRTVEVAGEYVCDVFWTHDPSGFRTNFETKSNWIDTSPSVGTEALFMPLCTVGSRAFTDHTGINTYVWMTFNQGDALGLLEGVNLLIRNDKYLAASSRVGTATISTTFGFLPGVQAISSLDFAWVAPISRNVSAEAGVFSLHSAGFVARAPNDMTFSFDSDDARRCVRFGSSMYISGSPIVQYDGVQLVELGFIVGPWRLYMQYYGFGSTGNVIPGGTYAYKQTLRSLNAKGETDRSTSFDVFTLVLPPSTTGMVGGGSYAVWMTRKNTVAYETWRTLVDPVADAPFYLITSQNPAFVVGNNAYVANTKTSAFASAVIDNYTDDITENSEQNPDNGGVLEVIPPPAARLIVATSNRVFLGGIAGDPDSVWYSRNREAGKVAGFNDSLTIDVPKQGGTMTALAFVNETLVVFRDHAVYYLPGDGYDNTGGGNNYGPARTVSIDCGAVSQETVVTTDQGVVFKSAKGWYLLDRSFTLQYIGAPVSAYDSDTVVSAHVVTSQHQIRFLTTSRILLFDYIVNQWCEWTISGGLSAALWRGTYLYLDATGVHSQVTDYTGITYGIDIETPWIKLNDLQGSGRVRKIFVLGEWRSSHKLRIRVARDYEYTISGAPNYIDDVAWLPNVSSVGSPEQVKHGPSNQSCESIKIRITAVALDGVSAPTGEALKLTGIGMLVGVHPNNLNTRLVAAQKD